MTSSVRERILDAARHLLNPSSVKGSATGERPARFRPEEGSSSRRRSRAPCEEEGQRPDNRYKYSNTMRKEISFSMP